MVKKKYPKLFVEKYECCGCSACYAICPKGAISMQTDEEGFFYPIINKEKCVLCNACIKVCVFKNVDSE